MKNKYILILILSIICNFILVVDVMDYQKESRKDFEELRKVKCEFNTYKYKYGKL